MCELRHVRTSSRQLLGGRKKKVGEVRWVEEKRESKTQHRPSACPRHTAAARGQACPSPLLIQTPTRAWRLVAQVISGMHAFLSGADRRYTRK